MSAATLRRAAALMRERAEAVIAAAAEPDQWFGQEELADCLFEGLGNEMGSPEADAAHIASWPPAVALAVADWLDSVADAVDADPAAARSCGCVAADSFHRAEQVAALSLGEATS